MTELTVRIEGEEAMVDFGRRLGDLFQGGERCYLQGDLGAGKTTLVRGMLRARGHQGAVKSPTYTLIEPYEFESLTFYHLDLYRLGDPEELEWVGVRDLFDAHAVSLIEWPERGEGWLPPADLAIAIAHAGPAREVRLAGQSERGNEIVNQLAESHNSTDL